MQVSDKETRAVFLNFKELRCLEKNLQVLDIEKAYSISLINLDQKVVKLSNKRLRDKVGKIKSYLPEGEIDELRWLDKMGKLGMSESASKLNCRVRIAAAEKRLKLQPTPRAKSAVPRIETDRTSLTPTPRSLLSARRCSTRLQSARSPTSVDISNVDKSKLHPNNVDARSQGSHQEVSNYPVPRSVREDRRKSITVPEFDRGENDSEKRGNPIEAFIKAQESFNQKQNEGKTTHKESNKNETVTINVETVKEDTGNNKVDSETHKETKLVKSSTPNVSFLDVPGTGGSSASSGKIRPQSVPATKVTSFVAEGPRSFTSMSHLNDVRKKCAQNIRRASRLIASGKTKSPFSCHNNLENEDKPKTKAEKPFRSIRDGVYAEIEKGPMENTLGSNLHKEIKRGLMLGEVATSLQIEDKIDNYMDKIQTYVKENPTAWKPYEQKTELEFYTASIDTKVNDSKKGSLEKAAAKPVRNKARRMQLEFKLKQGESQTVFLNNNFADIKKSRYLRVPDSMIDLSGVNTLAIDQMRMFSAMKSGGSDWNDGPDTEAD